MSKKIENRDFEVHQLVFAQLRLSSKTPPWPSRIEEKKGSNYIVRFLGDGRMS